MLFSKTVECPSSLDSFTAMLKNPRYYTRRWEYLDSKAVIDVNTSKEQIRVTSALDVSEDTVASISNLLNSGIQVRVVEIWDLSPEDIATKGSISVSLTGVPAKASGVLKVSAAEDNVEATVIRLKGDVICTVPLIGKGLEHAVVKRLDQALARELKVMGEFLS